MSADRDAQGPVVERYALARHGLPLPRNTASVPRAPWLPAAVRGRALPGSPRSMPFPSVLETDIEEAFDPEIALPPSLSRASDAGAVAPAARVDAVLPGRDASSPLPPTREHDEATTGNAPPAHAVFLQPDAPVQAMQSLCPPVDHTVAVSPAAVRQEAHRNDAIGDLTRVRDRPAWHESRALDDEASNAPNTTEHSRSAGPSFPVAEIPAAGSDPRHADRIESMGASTRGDRVFAPAERIAAAPAVAQQSRDARPISVVQGGTQMRVMGLAAAPLDPTRPQATAATGERPAPARQIGAAELAALQAPAPTPARSVRIDRVQVTVQAPAMPGPRPSGALAAMPATPARAPAQPDFRNPWSSYFTRRD